MNLFIKNKDKSLFLSIFMALNIVFLPYIFSFFIGNHDWDWIKGVSQVLSLNTGMFEARFGKFILNVALFSGHIFPILNTVVSFLFLTLGTIFLIHYFNIKKLKTKILIGLIAVLQPYILGWLYFPINTLGNFSAVLFVLTSLILSEKKSIYSSIIAILFFILALGVYPSIMEMMLIVFSIKHIINNSPKKVFLKSFSTIIISLILFKILLVILGYYKLINTDYYNLKTTSIIYILQNLTEYIKLFFTQLVLSIPFVPKSLKLISLIALILAILTSSKNKKDIFLWFIALSSTILSAVLTPNIEEVAYQPRVNFYGLGYLYIGAYSIILQSSHKFIKNVGFVLSIAYLILCINQNLYAQKVWNFGQRAEVNLIIRMSDRIEERASHLPIIPILADEISLRPRYYKEKYDKPSPYLLERSFIIRHIPSGMFNFYAPYEVFYKMSQISSLTPDLYNYLQTTSAIWPNKNSIYIDNNYAIIISTPKGLTAIKNQLPK